MTTPDNDAEDYWILDRAQILCLASARRMEILDLAAAFGPISIVQLSEALAAKPTALYHHVEKLEACGLLIADERDGAAVYSTPARRMRLLRALARAENEELMGAVVGALARQAARDFENAQARGDAVAEGSGRDLGFFRLAAAPDAEALAELNALFDQISELFWRSARGGGRRVALTWFLTPLEPAEAGAADDDDENEKDDR